jgi:hypothetical protein
MDKWYWYICALLGLPGVIWDWVKRVFGRGGEDGEE